MTVVMVGALAVPATPGLARNGPAGVHAAALVGDPLPLVDPFIGTRGGFNVFPGPDVPSA